VKPLLCSLSIRCARQKLLVKTANLQQAKMMSLSRPLEVRFEESSIWESLLAVVPEFVDRRWNWFDLSITTGGGGEFPGLKSIALASSIDGYRKYENGYVWALEAKKDSHRESLSKFPKDG
jgi:hypothetical protein